jgi:pre-mRNA-processing factor 40
LQLTYFDQFVGALAQAAAEAKAVAREKEKKAEREHRAQFRALLDTVVAAGHLHTKSRYKEVLPHIEHHDAFKAVQADEKNSK